MPVKAAGDRQKEPKSKKLLESTTTLLKEKVGAEKKKWGRRD